MVKYSCEKCKEEFSRKSDYTMHICEEEIITVKDVCREKINICKPILKWVGGKTQIMDKIIIDFPIRMDNYHEIFLGGGSVLLTLLTYVKNNIIKIDGKVYAYDLNEQLVYMYKNIQRNYKELYEELNYIIKEYNDCGNAKNIEEAKIAKENYYYWIRKGYNDMDNTEKNSVKGSAMFIFLNKTCFRGVFRVGPNGFNVPYGHYKNPEIINKEHLEEVHNLIKDVIFECCDFNISLKRIKDNDFVYLDPPYAPPENDKSFVGYTKDGFNIENHNKLFNAIHNLTDKNSKIMLSNADVKLLRENFTAEKYNIVSILCKRSINSKNPEAKAKEVIIKNY